MKTIGSKWKIPVMWYLMLNDGQHYNELKRSIGSITNTMLTKSLRELEEDGLLKRISKGTVPPSVTYHLTDTGKDLIYTMGDLFEWERNIWKKNNGINVKRDSTTLLCNEVSFFNLLFF
ncbi:winged helix-turn-helix transcriptional regulator [Limosilactobacillus balticus]|uniref:winged helix-turn-helix transcriptional regulator n=1 Tax=Limosilactobacillus balticus TaxID=2759747 RepID=UPI001E412594|nr:helix-turn-helix domain-containing protein [Limosilactobacillus balticus]